jgi:hypothetical protein
MIDRDYLSKKALGYRAYEINRALYQRKRIDFASSGVRRKMVGKMIYAGRLEAKELATRRRGRDSEG